MCYDSGVPRAKRSAFKRFRGDTHCARWASKSTRYRPGVIKRDDSSFYVTLENWFRELALFGESRNAFKLQVPFVSRYTRIANYLCTFTNARGKLSLLLGSSGIIVTGSRTGVSFIRSKFARKNSRCTRGCIKLPIWWVGDDLNIPRIKRTISFVYELLRR